MKPYHTLRFSLSNAARSNESPVMVISNSKTPPPPPAIQNVMLPHASDDQQDTCVTPTSASSTHSSMGGTTLSYDLLFEIKSKSNDSKTIFARQLIRHLFDEETRARSNIAGACGKMKLNPLIIAEVQDLLANVPYKDGKQ